MRLTIAERISLLDLLPRQGNVVTLRLITDLQKKIALTVEELEEFGVEQVQSDTGGVFVRWAPEFDKTRVDISLNDHEKGIVTRELVRLESVGQLTMNSLSLYDYFVDGKEPEET